MFYSQIYSQNYHKFMKTEQGRLVPLMHNSIPIAFISQRHGDEIPALTQLSRIV